MLFCSDVRIVTRTTTTKLNMLITNVKDKTSKENKSDDGVMSLRARNDGNSYIGETERTLLEPAKEHAYNDNDSAVTSIYRSSHPPRNIQELYISRGVTASV